MFNGRYFIITLIFFTIGLKMAIGTNNLVHELKDLKTIETHNIKQLPGLFKKVSEELGKNWNDELALEFAKVYKQSLKVDVNYFYLESFYPLLKKNESKKKLDDLMKKTLSEEEFLIYLDNVHLVQKEQSEGNG